MSAFHHRKAAHTATRAGAAAIALLLALLLPWPALAANRQVNEHQAADPNGTVEIINVAGAVDISGWDQNAVDVTGTVGDGVKRVAVTTAGNRTTVRVLLPGDVPGHDSSWGIHVGGGNNEARLVVKVPQKSALSVSLVSADLRVAGVSGNHHLQTVSGDISGEVGGTLQLGTVSGDVRLAAPNARTAQLETVSGDLDISGASGDVTAHTVSGDAVLTLGTLGHARFESVSGDLKVSAALAPDGQFDVASVSGDVHVDFAAPPDADLDVQSFSGTITNCFGPKPVTEQYGPGSRLNFRNGKGGGRVHIDTQSGDVAVCAKK